MDYLPNELLSKTLQYLDYFNLKRCTRVNKAFNTILHTAVFDTELFRSKKVVGKNERIDGAAVRFHPVFDCIQYVEEMPLEAVRVLHSVDLGFKGSHVTPQEPCTPLIKSEVANEQATDPPLCFARLRAMNIPDLPKLENVNGITVRQIFEALISIYKGADEEYLPMACWMELYGMEVESRGPTLLRDLVLVPTLEG